MGHNRFAHKQKLEWNALCVVSKAQGKLMKCSPFEWATGYRPGHPERDHRTISRLSHRGNRQPRLRMGEGKGGVYGFLGQKFDLDEDTSLISRPDNPMTSSVCSHSGQVSLFCPRSSRFLKNQRENPIQSGFYILPCEPSDHANRQPRLWVVAEGEGYGERHLRCQMDTNDFEYCRSSFPPFVQNPNADDARLMMMMQETDSLN